MGDLFSNSHPHNFIDVYNYKIKRGKIGRSTTRLIADAEKKIFFFKYGGDHVTFTGKIFFAPEILFWKEYTKWLNASSSGENILYNWALQRGVLGAHLESVYQACWARCSGRVHVSSFSQKLVRLMTSEF